MIEMILKNANRDIRDNLSKPLDALKSACNQVLAHVKETMAVDGKSDNMYDVVALNGYTFPCSIQEGRWVAGWI